MKNPASDNLAAITLPSRRFPDVKPYQEVNLFNKEVNSAVERSLNLKGSARVPSKDHKPNLSWKPEDNPYYQNPSSPKGAYGGNKMNRTFNK